MVSSSRNRKTKAAEPEEVFGDFGESFSAGASSKSRAASARANEVDAGVDEVSWQVFDRLTLDLAKKIGKEFNPELVVGVAKGGIFVGGAVAMAMKKDFFPVRISRRSRDRAVRGRPKAYGQIPREVDGRRVLVVDDVAASGETLKLAVSLCRRAGATAVKTATLVAKREGFQPDWRALVSESLVVFPWDYDPSQGE